MQRARRGTRVGEEGAFSFTLAKRSKKGKGPCFIFYFPYFGAFGHIQMLNYYYYYFTHRYPKLEI